MSDVFTQIFEVTADHPCFEGHFPSFPIFPAVGQIALLAETVSQLHGRACMIRSIPMAKFLKPVEPETDVVVELQLRDKDGADFVLRSTEGVVAKGKLTYRVLA